MGTRAVVLSPYRGLYMGKDGDPVGLATKLEETDAINRPNTEDTMDALYHGLGINGLENHEQWPPDLEWMYFFVGGYVTAYHRFQYHPEQWEQHFAGTLEQFLTWVYRAQ